MIHSIVLLIRFLLFLLFFFGYFSIALLYSRILCDGFLSHKTNCWFHFVCTSFENTHFNILLVRSDLICMKTIIILSIWFHDHLHFMSFLIICRFASVSKYPCACLYLFVYFILCLLAAIENWIQANKQWKNARCGWFWRSENKLSCLNTYFNSKEHFMWALWLNGASVIIAVALAQWALRTQYHDFKLKMRIKTIQKQKF